MLMNTASVNIGCAINSSSPLVTELCAAQGYDFLLIDSAIDGEKLRNLIQAAHAGGSKTVTGAELVTFGEGRYYSFIFDLDTLRSQPGPLSRYETRARRR